MSQEREYRREEKRENKSGRKTNVWMIIGVVVLIVLLLGWLTIAMFTGDTDVNAAPESIEAAAGMIMPIAG